MANLRREQALEGAAGQTDWGKAKELLVLPSHHLGLQYLPRSVGKIEAAEPERGLEGENRNQWRRLGWLSISSCVSVYPPRPTLGQWRVNMLPCPRQLLTRSPPASACQIPPTPTSHPAPVYRTTIWGKQSRPSDGPVIVTK